jgi:putative DNA primase/helicase
MVTDDALIARAKAVLASGVHTPTDCDEISLPPEPDDVPQEGRPVYPAPSAPLKVARKLYESYRNVDGLHTLLCWRGGWMRWRTTHWAEMDVAELRSYIYDELGAVDYMRPVREKGVVVDYEQTPWDPDKRKVANVLEAMQAVGHLSAELDPPEWIVHSAAETSAAQVISCANGLLDLSTRKLVEHTPALFNVVSVPFDYRPVAPNPVVWLEFLASVWPDDTESIALLQEYVGYILSGRTDLQKMLLLIGPTRSGKGTIARMLAELLGRGHVAGPTLASLGTNFGLSPLLGKPLAIVSDARLGDTPPHTVVERLLSITGEDMLTIDRKFREPWSGKLPTRFVVLSNELPKFRDSSGAIANRMLILQMTESFLGREDHTLDAKLRPELPGILAWALDGLDRLLCTGKFTVPQSATDAAGLMMDLASPVSAFVRDHCDRGPDRTVPVDDLYLAWKWWAEDNGHQPGAKVTFGRNLRSVVPALKLSQPTVDGLRARVYTGIGLRRVWSYTLNGFLPVQPVQGQIKPGQNGVARTGSPVHDPMRDDQPAWAALDDAQPEPAHHRRSEPDARAARAKEHLRPNTKPSPQTDAYTSGLCVDCQSVRHSAGRPRCNDCHRKHQHRLNKGA